MLSRLLALSLAAASMAQAQRPAATDTIRISMDDALVRAGTPSGSAGSSIANTARVSSPDFEDQNPANNVATATIVLTAGADLALAKTGSTTGGGGQVDTFVVTLTNNGPGTATGIVVTDVMSGPGLSRYNTTTACTVLPSAGTLAPASPWSRAQLSSGGTWSLASLANGASATLTFTCAGDNNDGVLNSATVTSASYDANAANNSASAYVNKTSYTDGALAGRLSPGKETRIPGDEEMVVRVTPNMWAALVTGGGVLYTQLHFMFGYVTGK